MFLNPTLSSTKMIFTTGLILAFWGLMEASNAVEAADFDDWYHNAAMVKKWKSSQLFSLWMAIDGAI